MAACSLSSAMTSAASRVDTSDFTHANSRVLIGAVVPVAVEPVEVDPVEIVPVAVVPVEVEPVEVSDPVEVEPVDTVPDEVVEDVSSALAPSEAPRLTVTANAEAKRIFFTSIFDMVRK